MRLRRTVGRWSGIWTTVDSSTMKMRKQMGVEPKIVGKPPKWMVKIMKNPIKMDDLGVPLFLETPKWCWGGTTNQSF